MKTARLFIVLLALSAATSFAGTLVQFQLFIGVNNYLGEVDVELYDQDKPVTTRNFVRLIQSGAYDRAFFHRLEPGFALQGGSFSAYNPFDTNLIAPPFLNIGTVTNFGNITNEFNVGKFYSNTNWTIAMAKTSDPNSANSAFFFNLANNAASLDQATNSGGFTVFGHVLRGTNVLSILNTLYYGYGLVDLTQTYGPGGTFTELPNRLIGFGPPPYYELLYFNLNLLNTQIQMSTNGARRISWNSVAGLTNSLEYATNLPPAWQVLMSTNGSGNPVTFTDSSNTNTRRYYRVHVQF